MTPLAHPNWASGNQNQDMPKVAFLVAISGFGRGMVGVPSSLTVVLETAFEAASEISRKIFIQISWLNLFQF
jgi:hypothetical protein